MIPALAFNDARSKMSTQFKLIGYRYEKALPVIKEFGHIGEQKNFRAKSSIVMLKDLTIRATSHTETYFERDKAETLELVIPIEGDVVAQTSGCWQRCYGGKTALLMSAETHKSRGKGSILAVSLDKEKLAAVYSSMLAGRSRTQISRDLCILPLELNGVSFFNLLTFLVKQIDIVGGDSKLLEKLAFDDRVYRLSAGLIYPHLLLSDEPISGRRPQVSSEIDVLCEYLSANLKKPISLTQMEQMSELSARNIQYAFRKEFGMGAREWLRKQRLHAARSALLDTHEHTTIASVAYHFCFVSASEFSRHYLREFGELPELTLSRRRY